MFGNFNGKDNYITALMFLSLRIITTEYGFSVGAIDLGSRHM